jgi:hypothetical protein
MTVEALDQLRLAAKAELDSWLPGDGLNDGFLEVRRTESGFVVCDREAAHPHVRAASRHEAWDFVVAIRSARPRLVLVRS